MTANKFSEDVLREIRKRTEGIDTDKYVEYLEEVVLALTREISDVETDSEYRSCVFEGMEEE